MGRSEPEHREIALAEAQELVYDAWDCPTAKQRIALAKRALKISPMCADAHALLAEHAEPGSQEALDLWRRGVEAGEAALGDAFGDYEGDFWGFHETRPYMRARLGLAFALWTCGVRDEAIDHLKAMLVLNPNDNQGVRDVLAAYLVETDRDGELADLLQRYDEGDMANSSWTKALAAFRRTGDCEESRSLLGKAMESNEHVPDYLVGKRRLPKKLPPYYSPGDKDEAILYVEAFRNGWTRTPGAIDWLRERT